MEFKMKLTQEEKDILNGKQGSVLAKIMKTVVWYGEIFGAKRLVPITHEGHLVTSMGIGLMKPVFRTMDEIINAGITAKWKFTVDPRPIDYKNVKCNLIDKLIFSKIRAQTRLIAPPTKNCAHDKLNPSQSCVNLSTTSI